MNRHDDTEQRVRAWLDDEARGELPDWVLDQTFSTTRSTPQRLGLRGWLPRRGDRTKGTTRRRNDMTILATMTAVAAAAVLAVNVFVEDTQPPPAGAELPTITVEGEMFTGRAVYGLPCVDEGGAETGECYELTGVSFDDPRLQGSVRMLANSTYMDDGIYRNQFIITTDEGAWVGDPVPGIMTGPDSGAPSVHLLTGEGAYDGLYAVATIDLNGGAFDWEGYVVHGGFPDVPER